MSSLSHPLSLTLRSYWRSSASWRVRIVLALKGLEYTYIPVHLVREGGEQHSPEHRALNPMAQVPHLTIMGANGGSYKLTQSVAIMDLLDHIAPTPRVIPSDPWDRAKVLELLEVINSGIQPIQNLSVLQNVTRMGGDKVEWASQAIDKGLAALEHLCQLDPRLTPGSFVCGGTPGAFEAALIPQLYNARRFKVELSSYRYLLALEERCAALEAFQRAAPDAQPDAQIP